MGPRQRLSVGVGMSGLPFVASLVLLTSVGRASPEGAIVDVGRVKAHTTHWACKGVLVEERLVATAARCLRHDWSGVRTSPSSPGLARIEGELPHAVRLTFSDGAEKAPPSRVEAAWRADGEHRALDLAFLQLDRAPTNAIPAAIAAGVPQPGATLWSVPCEASTTSLVQASLLRSGTACAPGTAREGELLLSASTCTGNSGSPVFDGAGQVVAILAQGDARRGRFGVYLRRL